MPTKDNDKVKLVEDANNSFDEKDADKDNAASTTEDIADSKAKSKVVSSHTVERNNISFELELHKGNKGSDKRNFHLILNEENVKNLVEFFGASTAARVFKSALGHYFKILLHGNFKESGDEDHFLARFEDPDFGLGRKSKGGVSKKKLEEEADAKAHAKMKAKLMAKGMSEEEAEEMLAE